MSAFIVSNTHIDAILTAGLFRPWRTSGDVRWLDAEEPNPDCYAEGEPWGPGSMTWFRDHLRYLSEATAGYVGAMLWAENRRSVNPGLLTR